MNAGKNLAKAMEQAKANAARTGTPRYVHIYNGTCWIGQTPVNTSHIVVNPDGTQHNVAGTDAVSSS